MSKRTKKDKRPVAKIDFKPYAIGIIICVVLAIVFKRKYM